MITKKLREYVTKKVAAFKVSDNKNYFIVNFTSEISKKLTPHSRLNHLLDEIKNEPFYHKYYIAKEYCNTENLTFEEFSYEDWKKS